MDAILYALSESTDYFLICSFLHISTIWTSIDPIWGTLVAARASKSQQHIDLRNGLAEVHVSIPSFSTGQQCVLKIIVGASLPRFITFSVINTISPGIAVHNQSQSSLDRNSTSNLFSNTTTSHLASPIHPHSSYAPQLLFLDESGLTIAAIAVESI